MRPLLRSLTSSANLAAPWLYVWLAGVREASFNWALNSPFSALSELPMQPLKFRKTKHARPKMPICFIMTVPPVDRYVQWYNFTTRIQSIFSGGRQRFQRGGACGYDPDFHRVFA